MADPKKNKEIELIGMNILNDGKQLSIRLPKRVVDALEIDPNKDIFIFEFDMKELHLKGELVDKQRYEKAKIE